jgi:hypothetical protein
LGVAISDWYNRDHKEYEAWAKLHPIIEEPANDLSLEKQIVWCRMAQVEATPTILLNGYRLPALYRFEDIKYFV